MASGKELPIGGDPNITPINPGKEDGTAAPGVQGGEGDPTQTPGGSEAQPGDGKPGDQVAQPGEGAGAAGSQPAAKPGQTAEERIQQLTSEVKDLKSQLSAVEDLQDLADELEEAMGNLRGLSMLESDSPTPPGGAEPGAKPTKAPEGVEGQLQALTQRLDELQGLIQKQTITPDERAAYQNFTKLEDDLLSKAGINDEKEVAIVKEMISKTVDEGKLNWTRPRVAKRVVRGAIDKYKDMKNTMLGTTVQPGREPTPKPGQPAQPSDASQYVPTPEKEGVDPLEQAAEELGPMIEAIFGRKGGGVT